MTKLQLQNEILKQFKRRLRIAYGGKWTDLYTLDVKKYAKDVTTELLQLTFKTEFHSVTIRYDACLNINVKCEGTGTLSCILRIFIDVAEECERYIYWLLSHNVVNNITFRGE